MQTARLFRPMRPHQCNSELNIGLNCQPWLREPQTLRRGRVITNAYCRNQPLHSLLCYRNSGRNETSGFKAGVGKDGPDTRHKAMTILGGSNVSGGRIPGGSGNKEESGTRVGVRPGRRDKLERAPRAGGETISQVHKGSGLVVDQVMELPEAPDVSPLCQTGPLEVCEQRCLRFSSGGKHTVLPQGDSCQSGLQTLKDRRLGYGQLELPQWRGVFNGGSDITSIKPVCNFRR